MPYKSRQAKISAAQRRFNYIKSAGDDTFVYEKGSRVTTSEKEHVSSEEINDPLFLKGDLAKIIILSLLIIIAQILLRLTLS